MKLVYKILIIGISFIGFNPIGWGQGTIDFKKWSVQFNVQHQDLAFEIDFGQLGVVHDVNIRPYYSLELQRKFRNNKSNHFFMTARAGYFNNLYFQRWKSFNLGLGWEYRFFKKAFAAIRLEVGRAQVKAADTQYIYEEGKWRPTENYDQGHWNTMVSNRVDLGYRVFDKGVPIDVFLNAQGTLISDFEFDILPYYGLGLGVRVGL